MARTGRFGRLPSAAPDLSSQIVAMMEQYAHAEDAAILDAWTNGGRFHGSPVTDSEILAHYRQRRDGYTKGDPEYSQWNSDLWQLRFQISDEKVMSAYRNEKIDAWAVARHYANWARRMPKDSSFYRQMMATHGDFVRAAKAAEEKGKKKFDYEAMMKRINALDAEIQATENVFSAIDSYAISKGFMQPGQSLYDPNVINAWEADDLQAMLTASLQNDPAWPDIVKGIRQFNPDFHGPVDWDRLDTLVDRQIAARRQKIREYKAAPYDMSQYIASEKAGIRDIRRVVLLGRQLDTTAKFGEALFNWFGSTVDPDSEGRIHAIDPVDLIDNDGDLRRAALKAGRQFTRQGFFEQAAFANALALTIPPPGSTPEEAAAYLQNSIVELQTTYGDVASNIFGSYGGLSTGADLVGLATQNLNVQNIRISSASDHPDMALMPSGVASAEQVAIGQAGVDALGAPWKAVSLPYNAALGYATVDDPLRRQVLQRRMSDGSTTAWLYESTEMTDDDGRLLGFVWDVEGTRYYTTPNRDIPGGWGTSPVLQYLQIPGLGLRQEGGRYIVSRVDEPEFEGFIKSVAGPDFTATDIPTLYETTIDRDVTLGGATGELFEAAGGVRPYDTTDWLKGNDPAANQALAAGVTEGGIIGAIDTWFERVGGVDSALQHGDLQMAVAANDPMYLGGIGNDVQLMKYSAMNRPTIEQASYGLQEWGAIRATPYVSEFVSGRNDPNASYDAVVAGSDFGFSKGYTEQAFSSGLNQAWRAGAEAFAGVTGVSINEVADIRPAGPTFFAKQGMDAGYLPPVARGDTAGLLPLPGTPASPVQRQPNVQLPSNLMGPIAGTPVGAPTPTVNAPIRTANFAGPANIAAPTVANPSVTTLQTPRTRGGVRPPTFGPPVTYTPRNPLAGPTPAPGPAPVTSAEVTPVYSGGINVNTTYTPQVR